MCRAIKRVISNTLCQQYYLAGWKWRGPGTKVLCTVMHLCAGEGDLQNSHRVHVKHTTRSINYYYESTAAAA